MFKEQQRINEILVAHFEDDKRQFEKLNQRVRAVEQRINYAAGAVAVIGLLTLEVVIGKNSHLTLVLYIEVSIIKRRVLPFCTCTTRHNHIG
jgi:hypothetical protein